MTQTLLSIANRRRLRNAKILQSIINVYHSFQPEFRFPFMYLKLEGLKTAAGQFFRFFQDYGFLKSTGSAIL